VAAKEVSQPLLPWFVIKAFFGSTAPPQIRSDFRGRPVKNIPDSATLVAVGMENTIEESSGVNDFFDFFVKNFSPALHPFSPICHAKIHRPKKASVYGPLRTSALVFFCMSSDLRQYWCGFVESAARLIPPPSTTGLTIAQFTS